MGADAWPTEPPRGCRHRRGDGVAAFGLAGPAGVLGPSAGPVMPAGAAPARAGFGSVFAVREFRVLWGSVVLSATGDRLALVALAGLGYGRTRSPLLAAVAFAAGYLPWLAGG